MIDRQNALNELVEWLVAPGDEIADAPVFFLEGGFGIGKSLLLENALGHSRSHGLARMVFSIDSAAHYKLLPELVLGLTQRLVVGSIRSNMNNYETMMNSTRLPELLRDVRQVDTALFEKIYQRQYLKTMFDATRQGGCFAPDDDDEDSRFIREYIDDYLTTAADKRMMCETGKVVAESLIVDMMNSVYPITESHPNFESYAPGDRPKDVVLMLDNYDNIEGSVDNWIVNYLLPYFTEKSFGEFISYDISSMEEELKVSDYFSIRVLLSSRNIYPKKKKQIWEKFIYGSRKLRLEEFSDDEINQFLKREGVVENNIRVARDFTSGNPYMLALWTDALNLSSYSDDVEMLYYHASRRILKYFTEEQKDWFVCASFLDSIDQSGLKCFPIIRDRCEEALSFLENLSDDYIERPDGELRVRSFLSKLIRESIKNESAETARQMENINEAYSRVRDVLSDFKSSEIEVLRNIAYFDHFDLEFALGKAFQEDSDKAEELISNHSSYFVKYGSVYSLNNKIRARLDEFNRIIDGTKYAHKKKLIEGIWDEYAGNIQRKIDHLKIDIAKYRDRIGQFRRQQDENAQRIEALKSDYLKSENELIARRRELDNATKKRKITPVIVLAFISVVFFIIGMAVGHVMADGETNGVLYLIRNALYSAGAVSGLMFLYHLGRLIFMLGRKGEYNHIVDRIEQIEQSRSASEKEMDEIRREVESGNPEIDKMERKIGDLENEIDELESMLDKPFIDRSGQG